MTRWRRGEMEVESLLVQGALQRITGGAANGRPLIEKASVTLVSAEQLVGSDPDSAFVLAYDAARHALTGLLAQQGLRATSRGGHVAVEQAANAQFGPGFRDFGALRRRRNELEYPRWSGDSTNTAEARESITSARRIIAASLEIVDQLGMF